MSNLNIDPNGKECAADAFSALADTACGRDISFNGKKILPELDGFDKRIGERIYIDNSFIPRCYVDIIDSNCIKITFKYCKLLFKKDLSNLFHQRIAQRVKLRGSLLDSYNVSKTVNINLCLSNIGFITPNIDFYNYFFKYLNINPRNDFESKCEISNSICTYAGNSCTHGSSSFYNLSIK